MPKRTDIKKILVIGSGPMIMPEVRHVNPFVKKDMKLF